MDIKKCTKKLLSIAMVATVAVCACSIEAVADTTVTSDDVSVNGKAYTAGSVGISYTAPTIAPTVSWSITLPSGSNADHPLKLNPIKTGNSFSNTLIGTIDFGESGIETGKSLQINYSTDHDSRLWLSDEVSIPYVLNNTNPNDVTATTKKLSPIDENTLDSQDSSVSLYVQVSADSLKNIPAGTYMDSITFTVSTCEADTAE